MAHREGPGIYSRNSLIFEAVLEWLVRQAHRGLTGPGKGIAVLGPMAYLLALALGPGFAQRGLSLGLAGVSLCWADFPSFQAEHSEAHHRGKSERDAVMETEPLALVLVLTSSLPSSALLTSLLMHMNISLPSAPGSHHSTRL